MKYEVVWCRGDMAYCVVVDSKNKAINLAQNKLLEENVDEIQIVKKWDKDDD